MKKANRKEQLVDKRSEELQTNEQQKEIMRIREQIAEVIFRNLDVISKGRPYAVITADVYGSHEIINDIEPLRTDRLLDAFARGEEPIGFLMGTKNRGMHGAFCGKTMLPGYSSREIFDFIKELTRTVNVAGQAQHGLERGLEPYFPPKPEIFGRTVPQGTDAA